jgi:hypothetical protein
VNPPTPPSREPHYFDNEQYGWSPRQCATNLISTLSGWCTNPFEFKGAAKGRVWRFQGDFADRAQLLFTTDKDAGIIELSVHETNWVLAEVSMNEDLKFRCWLEDPYEEKEFWPDGSDGKPNAAGDAPGRISKRGAWLQIRCADFPGAPDQGNGYWDLEDTFD